MKGRYRECCVGGTGLKNSAMTKEIGVGLLGAGFIGQMHSLSLGDVGRARREPMIRPDLVAIAERDAALARMMMERYGWREIVADWHSLVTRSDRHRR